MEVLNGLTFEEARKRVTKSFRESVESSSVLSDDKFTFNTLSVDGFSYLSSIPTIVVIVAYIVALTLVKFQHADLLIVICIVAIVMLLNFVVVALYRQSEKRELAKSLYDILSAYEASCDQMMSRGNETGSPMLSEPLLSPVLGQDDFKAKTFLSSGHSQVSIVHTYRDGQWMRLPVLLLAEGDIIALMGGDLTPGKCHEIERVNASGAAHTAPAAGEDGQFDDNENVAGKNATSWVIGRLMNAGEKVHIRNRQQFSQQKPAHHQHHQSPHSEEPVEEVIQQQPLHFGERHRSLAAESVEILGLCGDVRCFRLAETPIVSFLQSTTEPGHVSYNTHPISGMEGGSAAYSVVHTTASSNDATQTPSLIRTIFHTIVVQEGYKAFLVVSAATALASVARALLVNETSLGANSYNNLSYDDWMTSMLLPTATACVFFLPLALPLSLILAEALATADVLASAEVTLKPPTTACGPTDKKAGAAYTTLVNDTNPLLPEASKAKKGKRKGSHEADLAHGGSGSDGGSAEMEDEFMDEDIDERAEDIAEGINTQIRWSRYFGYLGRVLWHRLLLGLYPSCHRVACSCCANGAKCSCSPAGSSSTDSSTNDAYLPIPLARSRLLEVLGAVTMVCFVDDDVICEGYSVTEEIFLLMDNPQVGDTAHPSQKHKPSSASQQQQPDARSTDEADLAGAGLLTQPTSRQLTTTAAKGIVLDLHANPEATGSRFENPQWWRYLPSLKPLGLNAMLTYAYTATSSTQHDVMQQRQASGGGDGSAHGQISGVGSGRHRSNTNHLPYPPTVQRSPHGSAHDQGALGAADGDTFPMQLHSGQANQYQQTERSLVRHIRHLLPLESLRELAEEIGFEQADLSAFTRVLEVNVLAPGLENAHLLEDTHQWGQEESRRRGSLLPQLRGGVYKDFRDGSLQMMSLGDPSLVLNYCREYWDGSTRSITPLSSTDRAEVLSVYERWRLEDFEVVAFCYSPVPTGGLQPLLSKEDAHSQATVANITRHASASVSGATAGRAQHAALGHATGSFSLSAAGRAASVASPFIPAKHNTLFFVDPITTQDLHRIAAGITSKSKGGGVKANTRFNASQHHHAHNHDAEHTGERPGAAGPLMPSHAEGEEHEHENSTEEQDASLYDFYPETASAEPMAKGSSAFGTAKTGPALSPASDPMMSAGGAGIVRASSFTVSSDSTIPRTLGSKDNLRSGEDSPVRNPLMKAQDDFAVPQQQSPPQATRTKNTSVANASSPAEGSPARATRGASDSLDAGRKTSRSDASYMTPTSSSLCAQKSGHVITKSMSLDRVNEYNFDRTRDGSHDVADEEGFCKRAEEGEDSMSVSDADSLLLPLPLPGALRASTSDRDVRVKEHGGKDKVVVLSSRPSVPQPRSPVLLFPDEDDSSSVASSLAPSAVSSGGGLMGGSHFGRAATVETSNPTRAHAGIGVRFGTDSDGSPTDLGLSLDGDISGLSPDAEVPLGGSALTRSRTLHVTAPEHIAGGDRQGASGSLTPPLVPRTHFTPAGKASTVTALLSPQLRHHASEYVHPHHQRHHHRHGPGSALYTHITTSKQRQAQQVQRSHQQSRQLRRASTRQLWTQMRQQVFLGMAASSVPVRKDVPNTKEDLDSAGVRFVYFSAQNMKRSKPVAEKIGIPFDWNCAISLRELEGDTAQDPHRHISNYADWDVLAHMPHGIEAIKAHIQNVDNVPLLVSLFTDATPLSVRQMVEVFRDNGEVVLTIGGGYRSRNHAIYASSDVACSVSVLPGLGSTSTLPASERELIEQFPVASECSLCRADVLLSFRLIGLNTINLLQTPFRDDLVGCCGTQGSACRCKGRHDACYSASADDAQEKPFVINMPPSGPSSTCSPSKGAGALRDGGDHASSSEHLRLSVLLEVIRKGRILLRNMHQSLALFCVATLSLAAWPVVSMLVPLSLPPSPPPGLALLFQLIYVPAMCLTLLQCGEPEGVMKNTPRKNQLLRRPRDVARFCWYLALRSGYVLFSIALIGWIATASTMKSEGSSFGESMWTFYYLRSSVDADLRALWLVQDLMSAQALLSIIAQALTLLVRGQTELVQFPWPWRQPEAFFYVSSAVLLILHGGVLAIREEYRRLHFSADSTHSYANLDWFVWFALFILPSLGVVVGVLVNTDDQYHYKRYLQFLRLEFDTRLGMHSPR